MGNLLTNKTFLSLFFYFTKMLRKKGKESDFLNKCFYTITCRIECIVYVDIFDMINIYIYVWLWHTLTIWVTSQEVQNDCLAPVFINLKIQNMFKFHNLIMSVSYKLWQRQLQNDIVFHYVKFNIIWTVIFPVYSDWIYMKVGFILQQVVFKDCLLINPIN